MIKYIYTHDRSLITDENISEVMIVADFLQCTTIISLCLRHIVDNPTNGTIPLYARYCKPAMKQVLFYNLGLDSSPAVYLRNNYIDIIHHPDFIRNIIDVDDLEYFINPAFPLKREWNVLIFQVLLRWLKFSESREIHASKLLRKVPYGHMKVTDIRQDVLPHLAELSGCEDLFQLLKNYVEKTFEQPLICANFSSIENRKCDKRYVRPVLHVFGMNDPNVSTDMMSFCLKRERMAEGHLQYTMNYWSSYSELGVLEPKGDVLGHYAFIVGGYTQDFESEIKIPSALSKRYNMDTGEFLDLAPLPQASFWNAAVIHQRDHQMWILGGVVKKGDNYQLSQCVQIYDIKTNTWEKGPSLPEPLSQLAACYSSHYPAGIYVSGGITQSLDEHGNQVRSKFRMVRSSIYFISSDARDWEIIGRLSVPRYGHVMYADGSKFGRTLYAIGGKDLNAAYVQAAEYLSDAVDRCFKVPGLRGSLTILPGELYAFSESTDEDDEDGVLQIGSLMKPKFAWSNGYLTTSEI